tara:strand:+ start:298 stop:1236 length:939 start_codon:yes stop_codon:yes gene_type:complete
MYLICFSSINASAQRSVADKIVAIIEHDIITLSELQEKTETLTTSMKDLPKHEFDKRYQLILKQILDEEISEKLIANAVKENQQQLNISEQEVEQAIEEVQRMNNLSHEQLQSALYAQGIAWSEYRQQIKNQIERSRLMQMKVQGKIQFSEADLQQVCREKTLGQKAYKTCASHILFVPQSPSSSDVLKEKVKTLRQELIDGADFNLYADKYSADKSSSGGSLGCFSSGDMVESFEKATAKLELGEISPLVQTQFGYHLIKVSKRLEVDTLDCSLPQHYQRYQQEYFQEAMKTQTKIWLNKLRNDAHVEVYL